MSKGTLKQKQQQQDKERQAYAFYISKGWTPEQAIGIVGNLIRESNLNTTIVGTADDKGSQGVAQWHGDRLKTLKNKYGNNWTDFKNQLEFVDWELKNTEKAAGDKLRNAKGVWEAGTIVSDHYERPKVKFVGDEKRQSHVSDLAMKFKGIKLTPEDMPYANASYANSVAPYMNQQKETVTASTHNFDFLPQNTTFASVPDSVEKEETKTEETDKDVAEVEQKTKEFNFLDDLNTTAPAFKLREKQQIEAPQTDYMQQYEQISQFVENPQVAQQGKTVKDDKSRMIAHFMRLGIDVPREKVKVFPEAEVTPAFNFGWQPPQKKIEIVDNRKVNATTGKPINPNVDLTSGKYNQDTIKKIVVAANKIGIDPYTALSVGLQETKLGTTDGNIGHTIGKQDVNTKDIKSSEEYFVNVLKSKMDYANKLGIKDEDTILQTYNGLGKVYPETEQNYHGFKMKKVYGVDVPKEGIDMRKNPLYGKRIVDLRDNVLKQNPDLVKYVDSIVGEINPFTGKPKEENYIPQFQQGGAAQQGLTWQEKFTENELAFLSEIAIKDNNGQWANPGKITEINSNQITMQGVDYPLLGISKETGETKKMYPNKEYKFGKKLKI